MMPVAGHDLGEHDDTTFRMRWIYAEALYRDADAVLDDLHEAMTTLEDTERTARRVLGGAHPVTAEIEISLREARSKLLAQSNT